MPFRKNTQNEMNPVDVLKRFGLYFIGIFGILLLQSCATIGTVPPTRYSKAKPRGNLVIKNQSRYEKALRFVNTGNRHFIARRYSAALNAANRSLSTHESFEGYFLKGSSLFRQDNSELSLRAYREAEKIDPRDEQLLLSMGVIYVSRGELEPALEKYMALHEIHPKSALYAYKVGGTYKLLRKYEKAYEYLKKAEELGNLDRKDQLYLQLGDISLELKKYEEGKKYLSKARQINPKLKSSIRSGARLAQSARLMGQGNEAFKNKKYDEALKLYGEAREADPKNAGPYILSATTRILLKRYAQAIQDLRAAAKLNPGAPEIYSLLGSAHLGNDKPYRALEVLKRGLKIAPESHSMYNKKGLVLKKLELTRRAIEAFKMAVRLEKNFVPAKVNLAFVLLDDRRYEEAERQFKEAAILSPNDPELKKGRILVKVYAYIDAGDRFFKQRQFARAIATYRKALKLNEIPAALNSLGRVEFEKRNYNAAIVHYKKSLALDKKNVAAMRGLLRVYSRTRRRSKRNAMLARLKKLSKNDVDTAIAIARTREDEGKLVQAERLYLQLLKNHPKNTAAKRRLGFVYYKQGLERNKKEQFRRSLIFFQKSQKFNPYIPQLPYSIKIVQENIRFRNLLPVIKRAEYFYRHRKYAKALKLYESVYQKLKRPLILVKIASCHIALGRDDLGLKMLEDAERAPAAELAISEAIFTFFMKKGRLQAAEKGFKDIIRRYPDAYYSHYKLAIIDILRERYDKALDHLDKVSIYKPDFIVGYIARGVVLYKRGDQEEARKQFRLALARNKDASLAAFNLGVIFFNDRKTDVAKKLFEGISRRDPDFVDARYHLSYIYYTKNKVRKAERELEKVIKISPEPKYLFALAQVREKKYRARRSATNANRLRAIYNRILRFYPESKYAARSRRRLFKINPGEKVIQSYPASVLANAKNLLYGGLLLNVQGAKIRAYDAAEKRQLWSRRTGSKIKSILASRFLYVLSGNNVQAHELDRGEQYIRFQVPPRTRKIIGKHGLIAAVSGRAGRGKASISLYNSSGKKVASFAGKKNTLDYFFAGDSFYSLENAGKKLILRKLNEKMEPEDSEVLSIAGGRRMARKLRTNSRGKWLYLHTPGGPLYAIKGSSANKAEVSSIRGGYVFVEHKGDSWILAGKGRKLIVMDESGDHKRDVKLPVAVLNSAAVYMPRPGRYMFIGRDRKLYLLNREGRVFWKKKISRVGTNRAISVYY